jgi:hypothetical protein
VERKTPSSGAGLAAPFDETFDFAVGGDVGDQPHVQKTDLGLVLFEEMSYTFSHT